MSTVRIPELALVALIGASGSGKTSLVNVIAGLVKPEHARVAVASDKRYGTEPLHFICPITYVRHWLRGCL